MHIDKGNLAAALVRRGRVTGELPPSMAEHMDAYERAHVFEGELVVLAAGLVRTGPLRQAAFLRDIGRAARYGGEAAGRAAAVEIGQAWIDGGMTAAGRARAHVRALGTRARATIGAEELAGLVAELVRRERAGRVCPWSEVERALWLVLAGVEALARSELEAPGLADELGRDNPRDT